MVAHTAEAIVLRTYRYGEADRIVVFLTEDRGKRRGVAKNATKSRRRFGAALEPLTRGRVAYVERENRDLVRLDRIEGAVTPSEGTFEPPSTSVPGRAKGAWELGAEEPVVARVRIDAPQAQWAQQHVGPDHVVERADDGGIVVELPVTNRAAFRSFVLSFLEHAEVLDPPALRADVVAWLEDVAAGR